MASPKKHKRDISDHTNGSSNKLEDGLLVFPTSNGSGAQIIEDGGTGGAVSSRRN